jgi:hypothetical protein
MALVRVSADIFPSRRLYVIEAESNTLSAKSRVRVQYENTTLKGFMSASGTFE